MEYKIGIASTDGKVVNQHFGHTKEFLIVKVDEKGENHFLEKRKVTPPCDGGEHSEKRLAKVGEVISDCKYILCSQIGPGAELYLKGIGITPYAIPHFVDYAVQKIIQYDRKLR